MSSAIFYVEIHIYRHLFISDTPNKGLALPHNLYSITHLYLYIYDIITAVKGGPELQNQVFEITARALKWLFPSFPDKAKESVSVKKIQVGEA